MCRSADHIQTGQLISFSYPYRMEFLLDKDIFMRRNTIVKPYVGGFVSLQVFSLTR